MCSSKCLEPASNITPTTVIYTYFTVARNHTVKYNIRKCTVAILVTQPPTRTCPDSQLSFRQPKNSLRSACTVQRTRIAFVHSTRESSAIIHRRVPFTNTTGCVRDSGIKRVNFKCKCSNYSRDRVRDPPDPNNEKDGYS